MDMDHVGCDWSVNHRIWTGKVVYCLKMSNAQDRSTSSPVFTSAPVVVPPHVSWSAGGSVTPLRLLGEQHARNDRHGHRLAATGTARNLTSAFLSSCPTDHSASLNSNCDSDGGEIGGRLGYVLRLHSPYKMAAHSRQNQHPMSPRKWQPRPFRASAERALWRCLQAPGLEDDYYLNVLDWSPHGTLAIALSDSSVHWCQPLPQSDHPNSLASDEYDDDAHKGRREPFRKRDDAREGSWRYQSPGDQVTSLKWSATDESLLVGTKHGQLLEHFLTTGPTSTRVIDSSRRCRLACMDVHPVLQQAVVGGKDRQAVVYDLRHASNNGSAKLALRGVHEQEICGVALSPNGLNVASGSNDNVVSVWDLRQPEHPMALLREHMAAVKALCWLHASNSKLVTGGGTADRCLRLWDLHDAVFYAPHDKATPKEALSSQAALATGSQVTALIGSRVHPNVVYGGHGFSDNWAACYQVGRRIDSDHCDDDHRHNYDQHQHSNHNRAPQTMDWTLTRVGPTLTGHTQRVLWMAAHVDADGQEWVATAGGDECIRLWRPLLGTNVEEGGDGEVNDDGRRHRGRLMKRSFSQVKVGMPRRRLLDSL
jgi:WD40 repeat protein